LLGEAGFETSLGLGAVGIAYGILSFNKDYVILALILMLAGALAYFNGVWKYHKYREMKKKE